MAVFLPLCDYNILYYLNLICMTIVAKSNGPMRMCSTDMLYDIMLHISGEGGERETHGDWSEEGGGRDNVQLKTDRE